MQLFDIHVHLCFELFDGGLHLKRPLLGCRRLLREHDDIVALFMQLRYQVSVSQYAGRCRLDIGLRVLGRMLWFTFFYLSGACASA